MTATTPTPTYPGAELTHREDCPEPSVLTTRIHHWRTRAIGRCINCERVGLVDVPRETSSND